VFGSKTSQHPKNKADKAVVVSGNGLNAGVAGTRGVIQKGERTKC
jgi:hypothetical protein